MNSAYHPAYQQFVQFVAGRIERDGLEEARRSAGNLERNLGLDAAKLLKAAQESLEADARKEVGK